MSGRKEKRLRIVIFLVIASIITISLFAFNYTQKVKATSLQINYTKNILLGLNDLYYTVIEHAGSARSYSLNGNGKEQEIEKVRSTAALLLVKLKQLTSQIKGDTAKQRLADSLENYITKRIDHSNQLIIEGEKNGKAAAEALYETGTGREYNNLIFSFINQLQATELGNLQLNEQKNTGAGRKLSFVIIGLLGFITALVVFIIQKIRLDMSEQSKVEDQLKKFNETLEKQVKIKTEEKEFINSLLNERIKELTLLHRISQLLESENKSTAQLLQEAVNTLPSGWQHTAVTAARINWKGEAFVSPGYADSQYKQSINFQRFDGESGTIDIVYLEERPDADEGPFLAEERKLLNTLAEMLQAYFNRKHAEDRLQHSYEEIRQLASYIEKAREDEKIKIAREIHDDLGQQLTGLKMDLTWLEDKLNFDENALRKKVDEMKQLLDEIVRSVRRIASDLRPGILDDLGLVAAIKWQSSEFQKRSGIPTTFHTTSPELEIPPILSTGLFRIFQESLTNVARHSSASRVTASLDVLGNDLVLKIEDDGVGFNVFSIGKKRTLGLLGMKERTALMGGRYEIVSYEGRGTCVRVSIPFS